MRDVVFVEVFAVVEGLQPELTKSFALSVGAHYAVHTNETRESHAVEAFLIKDCGGIPDAFGHVWVQC